MAKGLGFGAADLNQGLGTILLVSYSRVYTT